MARVTYYCPECGTDINLSRPLARGKIITCPECDAAFAAPSRGQEMETEHEGYAPEERRSHVVLWVWLGLGFGFLLLLVACAGIGAFLWYGFREEARPEPASRPLVKSFVAVAQPTTFPPQTEDYAEARKKFKTKLLQQNPSPQQWDMVDVPPGVTEMEYPSGELRLKAWVSNAPEAGKEKKPAVLFLHLGLAFGEEDWEETEAFRNAGYVVMAPMLRGENGLPGSFSLFYDEVDDVLAAADALAKLPYVDSKRLYLAGHGEGGTLALLAAMTSPRFRAAASFSGSPDQVLWTRDRAPLMLGLVPFELGDDKELQMRSPLAFPASFKCPVRLYFGSEEVQLKAGCQKLAELAKEKKLDVAAELAKEKKLDVAAVEAPGNQVTSLKPAMKQCITFFKQH